MVPGVAPRRIADHLLPIRLSPLGPQSIRQSFNIIVTLLSHIKHDELEPLQGIVGSTAL